MISSVTIGVRRAGLGAASMAMLAACTHGTPKAAESTAPTLKSIVTSVACKTGTSTGETIGVAKYATNLSTDMKEAIGQALQLCKKKLSPSGAPTAPSSDYTSIFAQKEAGKSTYAGVFVDNANSPKIQLGAVIADTNPSDKAVGYTKNIEVAFYPGEVRNTVTYDSPTGYKFTANGSKYTVTNKSDGIAKQVKIPGGSTVISGLPKAVDTFPKAKETVSYGNLPTLKVGIRCNDIEAQKATGILNASMPAYPQQAALKAAKLCDDVWKTDAKTILVPGGNIGIPGTNSTQALVGVSTNQSGIGKTMVDARNPKSDWGQNAPAYELAVTRDTISPQINIPVLAAGPNNLGHDTFVFSKLPDGTIRIQTTTGGLNKKIMPNQSTQVYDFYKKPQPNA